MAKFNRSTAFALFAVTATLALGLFGCAQASSSSSSASASASTSNPSASSVSFEVSDTPLDEETQRAAEAEQRAASEAAAASTRQQKADTLRVQLDLTEDYREEFVHGDKGPEYQKYIVLHDTEGDGEASGVIDYWDGADNGVAAHFIINKDGSIWQCVPLDKIAHHAGFGDTGHNESFGVSDESRDDKVGTVSIGDWASDYGMNSYSIGIEMVHVGATDTDYPVEQLEALDKLIAYIDAYYGFESAIIDHNDWRSGNSDTSEEFQPYMASYKEKRTHQ